LRGLTEEDKNKQIWRRKDYGGKPDRLVWNSSSYEVFRHVVILAASGEGKRLEQLMRTLEEGLTGKAISHGSLDVTLRKLSEVSDRLASQVARYNFTQQSVLALMKSISGDRRRLSTSGFLAAEQAVLAVASLYDAYVASAGEMSEAKAIKDTIDGLYKEIRSGWAFNSTEFEARMNELHRLLSKS
jgi:hypothetical protein